MPFGSKKWILKICYLNDIFNAVNDLNTSIQGRNQNIISLSERLSATVEDKTGAWTYSNVFINEQLSGGMESNCN